MPNGGIEKEHIFHEEHRWEPIHVSLI